MSREVDRIRIGLTKQAPSKRLACIAEIASVLIEELYFRADDDAKVFIDAEQPSIPQSVKICEEEKYIS